MPDRRSGNSVGTTAPGILLMATLRWPIAARLAVAFAKMGCRVEAICARQHPVTRTLGVRRIHPYAALKPLTSLRKAIQSAAPDLIIPCDDNAALQLHELYVHAGKADRSANTLRDLIARSLGTPEACALATARGRLMALAAAEGVRVPESAIVTTPGDLKAWLTQHRFPAAIKVDGTWGGQGVSTVRDHEEAQRAFRLMAARPDIVNVMVRTVLDRDPSTLLDMLTDAGSTITVQDFIHGAPANRAVACWQGRVLAGISVEAIRTQHPTGPATVVRVIENPEMSEAVNRLVRRLGISGLWGFDFVLETSTGAAYLIEVNPRATPICHLPLGEGRDLPVALYTQLSGVPPVVPPTMIHHEVVAMFPGEWRRNPASHYLRTGYHDVPWDEPGLVEDCLDRPWSERGLVARWWARMRPKPFVPPARRQEPASASIAVDDAHDHSTPGKFEKRRTSFAHADEETTVVR
jgi:hypothetical protein